MGQQKKKGFAMARKRIRLQKKITGSTILEVIISMVIIMLTFGIAMMIYSNVTRLSLSTEKMQAQAILLETMRNLELSKDITSQSIVAGDFSVEQSVKPFNDDNNLISVSLIAYDDNHQEIAVLKKVIIRKDD